MTQQPEPAGDDRRRLSRKHLRAAVTFTHSLVGEVEGVTRDLTCYGALIETKNALPGLATEGTLVFSFPRGEVRARGKVVRVDLDHSIFAVELLRIHTNGDLLLAGLLCSGRTLR